MEAKIPEQSRVITVCADFPTTERASASSSKPCDGAVCGFSDSKSTSEDAGERSSSIKKLFVAVTLCLIFMSIEVIGGIKANSLAILTDAAHLLLDVAAFAISLLSLWAAGWEANPRQSYGFFRIEILGALISIQLIWLLAGILVYEAIDRLIHDTGEVQGFLMFLVAAFGLLVNIAMAFLLGHDHNHEHDHGHHSHEVTVVESKPLLNSAANQGEAGSAEKTKARNINVHSAYLHVLGDSIQSVGVMIGGAIIWYKPEWKIIDLICTIVFSAIVLGTTIQMLRNILEVLMESTPREIDATRLEKGMCEMEEVVAIHELHIWAITVGKVLLACHVTVRQDADADVALQKIVGYIKREYNIGHVTIQIERE